MEEISAVFLPTLVMALLGAAVGFGLCWLHWRLPRDESGLAARIDALLPQTQCAQCGFPGCRPYAQAIVAGDAAINQCPPGGDAVVVALAQLLDLPVQPVDGRYGMTKPPQVAYVDEIRCIGCTLCLPACPVDAIVGARRYTHTVIAAYCTGCELCLPPCPVDCIELLPLPNHRDGDSRPAPGVGAIGP